MIVFQLIMPKLRLYYGHTQNLEENDKHQNTTAVNEGLKTLSRL